MRVGRQFPKGVLSFQDFHKRQTAVRFARYFIAHVHGADFAVENALFVVDTKFVGENAPGVVARDDQLVLYPLSPKFHDSAPVLGDNRSYRGAGVEIRVGDRQTIHQAWIFHVVLVA